MPHIHWIEARLHVADVPRSIAFYHDVLGFETDNTWPEGEPEFAILVREKVCLQLCRTDRPGGGCTLCVDVDNALAFHQHIKQRVAIEWGPEVYFYGRREFAFRDPDGHLIVVTQRTTDPVDCPAD
jgi:catechol 2,3-dioxygenase-like lactoylglutathione lyase family enzyme